jgi:hypothetical protein
MHYYMTEGQIPVSAKIQRGMIPHSLFKEIDDVQHKERAVMPHLCHGDDRNCTFNEVEGALTEEQALAEADRCLRCGTVCYDQDMEAQQPIAERAAQ